MKALLELTGRRFARLVTDAVVARPAAWRLLRPLFRRQWNWLAPSWEQVRRPDTFDPYLAALNALPEAPARAVDVGTAPAAVHSRSRPVSPRQKSSASISRP